jgi:Protein kinase domain
MNASADFGRASNRLNTGTTLRQLLDARANGELSDDELIGAIRGAYTQSEFVAALSAQIAAEPRSAPRIAALIDQLARRGDTPVDLIRLIEARISSAQEASANDGITVDLGPDALTDVRPAKSRPALRRVEVGRVLRNRYEIEQCLGSGGKGAVFRALDRYRSSLPSSQRHVALKILHDCKDRDGAIEALRRELQSAQTLSHPNIVKVYDVDRDSDVDFFTMELLEGELLSDLMRRFQAMPMPRPHAWGIIRQIASGLEHAHARKIVHADLKPQNIMVTKSGEVRILDFGSSYRFAKESQVEPAWRESSSATPAYACCELLDGRAPDPRDDLYALACIAYELLSGAHPFQRRRANEARDFGVVPVRPAGLGRRQWQTLAKGLSWHRAGRTISVGDWFKGLKPSAGHSPALAGVGELKRMPPRRPPAPPLRPFAVLSVLLCIAGISLLFVRLAPGGKVTGAPLSAFAVGPVPVHAIPAADALGEAPSLPPAHPIPAEVPVSHGAPILPTEYQVLPGQHFAEIRVHRPAKAGGNDTLTWWTEPASAKPGIDYVSQGKVSQAFPKGENSMSVFVKLLPKAKRSESEVFYVAVAGKGDKPHEEIKHTAVHLPPSRNSF